MQLLGSTKELEEAAWFLAICDFAPEQRAGPTEIPSSAKSLYNGHNWLDEGSPAELC